MGTTRQRQRLLINGLMTVFLLSLLGGCGSEPAPPADNAPESTSSGGTGASTGTTTTAPVTSGTSDTQTNQNKAVTNTTQATNEIGVLQQLKKELAEIKNLVSAESIDGQKAQTQLTQFTQNFNSFSFKYQGQDNDDLNRQIKKINDLLQQAEDDLILLNNDNQGQVKQSLPKTFEDIKKEFDNLDNLVKTPLDLPDHPNEIVNSEFTISFGNLFLANFLATGFAILLLMVMSKVLEEMSNPRRKHKKSSGQKPLVEKIELLTKKVGDLASGITNIQDHWLMKSDIESLEKKLLDSIQKEIKTIPSSISGSVGRTSSYDNTLVQPYLNQIETLRQEKENKDCEIQQLRQEKKEQSNKIIDLEAQLNRLSNSDTNAVSSVQYNQLEQRFNYLSQEYETLKNNYNNLEQSIRNNNAANQGELEKRDRKLRDVQQELNKVKSDLTEVTAERDGLQEERDKLEEKLNKFNRRQSSNDNSYQTNSNEVFSGLSIGTQSNNYSSSPLTADTQDLINQYNQNPKSLQNRKAAAVEFPESNYDAFRSGNQPAILENTTKTGGYLVVNSSSNTWLFPPDTKLNLRGDYYTLSALYECHQYQENLTKFTLIKPAKVSNLGSGRWQLIEKGELQFTS